MNRLLVLGGGRHQTPLISRAEERGVEVVVVDYLPGSPGHAIATYSVVADATDPVVAAEVAETYQVDGVTTTGTDIPIRAMAAVAEEHNLPSYIGTIAARMATDKGAMHEALSASGVPMAHRVLIDDTVPLESLPVPAVVKPADSQGQRGITSVQDRHGLAEAIANAWEASRSGRVVVEEFVDGPEFTANAWISGGEVAMLLVNDRVTFNPSPYLGIAFQHIYPSKAAHDMIGQVGEITGLTAKAYGIETGPLYIQMIRSANRPIVVEAAARIGGGHESRMLLHLTGWSSDDALIDLALGRMPSIPPTLPETRHALVNFILGRKGVVNGVDPMPSVQGILEAGWYVSSGHQLEDVIDGQGRVGYFLAEGSTSDELMTTATDYYAGLKLPSAFGENLVRVPERALLNRP